ncbi:hypothetical protein [Methylobacterium planeticum]|nr:hypothetical protein [Methylobacterium planeticum]
MAQPLERVTINPPHDANATNRAIFEEPPSTARPARSWPGPKEPKPGARI